MADAPPLLAPRNPVTVTPRVAWLRSDDPDADPALPLGARRGVRRDLGGGEMCWDFGTPGLDGVTTTASAQGLFAALVLPLSVIGVVTLTWDDWPRALTVFLGLVGVAGCLFSALLVVWPFFFAASWRERIHLTQGRIAVTRGVWPFRRVRDLGPAAGVTVRDVPRDPSIRAALLAPNRLGGPGEAQLELVAADGVPVRVGTWLDHATARRLRDRLRVVIAAERMVRPELASPPPPLGWTLVRLGHAASRALRRFRQDPAPTLFDVSVFLGMGLAASLPETQQILKTVYGPLVVLGLLAFWVLAGVPARVAGLTPEARGVMRVGFVIALGTLALVAGVAGGALTEAALVGSPPRLDLLSAGLGLAIATALAVLVGRRAFGTATGAPRRILPHWQRRVAGIVFVVALVGVTWVHEGWAWAFVTDSRRGLGPLSIAMLPTVAALLVWPTRSLFTLAHPFEDGPRWVFVWILLSFAVFALAGVQL